MSIFLQFRLAYVAPESRVVGAGDLVDHPKKIAINYLSGYFVVDFFIVLPLPQVNVPFLSSISLTFISVYSIIWIFLDSILIELVMKTYFSHILSAFMYTMNVITPTF